MAMQILMLVAISIKFAQDNCDKTLDDPAPLCKWCTMVYAFGRIRYAFCRYLVFLHCYFLLGVRISKWDLYKPVEYFEVGEIDNVNSLPKRKYQGVEGKDRTNLHSAYARTFSTKLFYPFRSPPLVLVCILYGAMQFAFVLVSIVSIQANGGVIFYYFFTVILGLIANAYVFAVGALWVAIIIGVLLLIALIVFAFVLLIILLSCGGSSRQQRRNY